MEVLEHVPPRWQLNKACQLVNARLSNSKEIAVSVRKMSKRRKEPCVLCIIWKSVTELLDPVGLIPPIGTFGLSEISFLNKLYVDLLIATTDSKKDLIVIHNLMMDREEDFIFVTTVPYKNVPQYNSVNLIKFRCCGACSHYQRNCRKCTGCAKIFYCSRECQKSHWCQHKTECKKIIH
jgi:hypothetical protein